MPDFEVLLYYKFVPVPDPIEEREAQRELCRSLGLLGRILVAAEGINGTVSGPIHAIAEYRQAMDSHPLFRGTEFKVDPSDSHVFKKLIVKERSELVTIGPSVKANPIERTGERLSPAEFRRMLLEEDVLLIDGRNDYEYEVGRFRGAIRPPVETFKEFPDWIRKELGENKDKKILTYCTGGIRCEKLTAFMIGEGFENVYQLDGGIVTYGKDEATRGDLFEGKCFVFDERLTVPISPEESIVGTCLHCGSSCDRYVNCANVECNRLYFSCPTCEEKTQRCCSVTCEEAPVHREARKKLWESRKLEKVEGSIRASSSVTTSRGDFRE